MPVHITPTDSLISYDTYGRSLLQFLPLHRYSLCSVFLGISAVRRGLGEARGTPTPINRSNVLLFGCAGCRANDHFRSVRPSVYLAAALLFYMGYVIGHCCRHGHYGVWQSWASDSGPKVDDHHSGIDPCTHLVDRHIAGHALWLSWRWSSDERRSASGVLTHYPPVGYLLQYRQV